MPEITTCPECDKKLRVPDDLIGKKVKCPGCAAMFTAQTDRPAARDDEDEDEPPRRPKLSQSEGVREGRASSRGRGRDEDDENEPPRRRSRRDEEDEDEDDRPRSRRRDEGYEDEESHRRRPRRRDEDDYEDDYDRPRGREIQGWRGVRAGLNLVVIAGWLHLATIGVAVLGVGFMALLGAFASRQPAAPGQPPAGIMALGGGVCAVGCVVILLALAELITRLIGWGMCMQAPSGPNRPARGLCVAAFCCALGAFLVSFVGGFMQGFNAPPPGAQGPPPNPMAVLTGIGGIISLSSNLVALASFVLWLFFLRAVCLQMRNSSAAGKVMTFIIAQLVYIVLSILLVVVMLIVVGFAAFGALARRGGPNAAAGAVGGLIAFLVVLGLVAVAYVGLYVWYVLLVTEVRGVVERHVARR